MDDDPIDVIEGMVSARRDRSDSELLVELSAMLLLPRDTVPDWEDDGVWRRAYLLVAFGDLAASRKLREAVPLILERMCLGDPGELMRGMRHALEDAVDGKWDALVQICEECCRSSHAGARYWAADELGVLRETRSVPILAALLDDTEPDVVENAAFALTMIAKEHPSIRSHVIAALHDARSKRAPLPQLDEAISDLEKSIKDT